MKDSRRALRLGFVSLGLLSFPFLLSAFVPQKDIVMRVMTYNVHSCKGLDWKTRPDRIASIIALYHPDVVALQEIRVGRTSPSVPFVDQPRLIAKDMYHVFYPLVRMKDDDFGIAVLSRFPLRLIRVANLPTVRRRRPLEQRGAMWLEIEIAHRRIQILTTHLGLHAEEKAAQTAALLGADWIGNEQFKSPFVICGDFNSRPTQTPYKRLVGVASDAARPPDGSDPRKTWPSFWPIFRIDHVLASTDFQTKEVQVPRTSLTRVASDHLPVIVDLVLRPTD